jgi:Zn2+/Cd2+-exporting ATPase
MSATHDHPHPPETNSRPPADACCGGERACSTAVATAEVREENSAAATDSLLDGPGRTTLKIAGMDCADEVAILEKTLRPMEGILGLRASLMAASITVEHDARVTPDQLIAAIAPTGMTATRPGRAGESAAVTAAQSRRKWLVGISGALTGFGLVLEWSDAGPEWSRALIFAAATLAGGWFIFPKGLAALRRLSPDMNLLMSVAVLGAAAIGEWSEAAAVTFLFGLSELLEAFSVQRARRAIESLLKLAPETAFVKADDTVREVPVEQVRVGDTLAVKSGARVPLDGEVLAGESSINQAPITGESMPVEKRAGDTVFAGTINGEGALEVRVTKGHNDTTLARIIHMVEEAQGQKAPSQRFVDVFAKYYTPAVMVLAIAVALAPPLLFGTAWGTWIYRALVLLVIACPCALVISTPVSIVSGLTAMARRGVLIKGGAHLESIGKLRALAVDKTGTITEGKPRVRAVHPLGRGSEAEVLRIAAAIDTHSEHPLALAVVAAAQENGVAFPRSGKYQARTGRGADATIEGREYFVGNHRFAHEIGVCSEEIERRLREIEEQALSVVIVGHKPHGGERGGVLGILAIGDTIRPNAADALRAIHAAGVQKVVMLSGDNQRTADAIARQAGIDEAQGDLLPDQKVERVKALMAEHRFVGMVGDGVNDAPAMAAATLGIAMGAAGTDTAIETADIALMKDDLSKVAEAVRLGRRTLGIIQFNVAFSLAVKAIFLVLALLGYTSLWLAIAADTGATLVVVANALRLLAAPRDAA